MNERVGRDARQEGFLFLATPPQATPPITKTHFIAEKRKLPYVHNSYTSSFFFVEEHFLLTWKKYWFW
jgi:hypothetical protein